MAPQLDPQFKIRMPADLRNEIETAAAANHRSMNAEIVARLSGDQRTLRDEFARQASAHLMLNCMETLDLPSKDVARMAAKAAYMLADAMLAERSK